MDLKSKILFSVMGVLIVLSISASYYKYMVLHDYIIEAQIDCDPSVESCFVYVCDPEAEECAGNPEDDTSYYKYLYRNAKNIPLCDPADEGCDALVCPESEEEGCQIIACSAETLATYEVDGACTNPVDFKEAESTETEIFLDELTEENEGDITNQDTE